MPGTIRYRDGFDPAPVVEALKNAMGGLGTDEDAVIDIMGNHCYEQRLELNIAYKTAYGKDLVEEIKSELSGDFEETVVAMLTAPRKLDAQRLHDAMSGGGTDESALIDVLVPKSNKEIEEIKAEYKLMFDADLEEDLQSDTSGYFRRLMVSLVAAGRETDEWICDEDRAKEDAQKFYDAGEARWGTDEADLNAILCLRSRCHLQWVFHEFQELAGKSIEESIEDECSGDLKDGYLAIVDCCRNIPNFFARRIKECCEGFGTKDSHLIYIVVSRSEIDMEEIEQVYEERYERSVIEEIDSECGGDYKKIMLAILKMQE